MKKHILKAENAVSLWNIFGNFGRLDSKIEKTENGATAQNAKIKASCLYHTDENGVTLREDFIENISENAIVLNGSTSVFEFNNSEYEVYTQFNIWLNESLGKWHILTTSVSASPDLLRTCMGATPFMVLWNKQIERGTVFHLLPNSLWEMTAKRFPVSSDIAKVAIEAGIKKADFNWTLGSGEKLELPKIICYETENKVDFDAWKLHNFMNNKLNDYQLPVIYNTWLCNFDEITPELLKNQIDQAAELGAEYFVIDAGWFGEGADWSSSVGDWYEKPAGRLNMRLREISDYSRDNGLKFGLWLELERAVGECESVKNNPDYYIYENGTYFLNFAKAEAREFLLKAINDLKTKYNIEFLKFDFNADLSYDPSRTSFLEYYLGYEAFIKELKRRFPEIYLENCASGGMRMSLSACSDFDSFWPTDCQSPYEGLRIFKDTLLRFTPQMFEKWVTIKSLENFSPNYPGLSPGNERILATNDACWNDIRGVYLDFLKGYMLGGPICFSCDLTKLSADLKKEIKGIIEEFKKEHKFWKNAVCRKLTDTESMLVLEYSDMAKETIKIQVFSFKRTQNYITVYPNINTDADYVSTDGKVYLNAELKEGIDIEIKNCYRMSELNLKKVN